MASSSQVRSWWAAWECNPGRFVKVGFPGPDGKVWNLSVADRSAPVWKAAAQIMATEPYLFRESAGGTYNCRPPSLHAYALALDLNPSQNPMKPPPLVTDMPQTFIARMEGIRANGNQALQWGGRWPSSNPPDPMHYQINVAPVDCDGPIEWDHGGGQIVTWEKPGDDVENVYDADRVFEWQGTFAPGSKQASYDPADFQEANDRVWTVMGRITDWIMVNGGK